MSQYATNSDAFMDAFGYSSPSPSDNEGSAYDPNLLSPIAGEAIEASHTGGFQYDLADASGLPYTSSVRSVEGSSDVWSQFGPGVAPRRSTTPERREARARERALQTQESVKRKPRVRKSTFLDGLKARMNAAKAAYKAQPPTPPPKHVPPLSRTEIGWTSSALDEERLPKRRTPSRSGTTPMRSTDAGMSAQHDRHTQSPKDPDRRSHGHSQPVSRDLKPTFVEPRMPEPRRRIKSEAPVMQVGERSSSVRPPSRPRRVVFTPTEPPSRPGTASGVAPILVSPDKPQRNNRRRELHPTFIITDREPVTKRQVVENLVRPVVTAIPPATQQEPPTVASPAAKPRDSIVSDESTQRAVLPLAASVNKPSSHQSLGAVTSSIVVHPLPRVTARIDLNQHGPRVTVVSPTVSMHKGAAPSHPFVRPRSVTFPILVASTAPPPPATSPRPASSDKHNDSPAALAAYVFPRPAAHEQDAKVSEAPARQRGSSASSLLSVKTGFEAYVGLPPATPLDEPLLDTRTGAATDALPADARRTPHTPASRTHSSPGVFMLTPASSVVPKAEGDTVARRTVAPTREGTLVRPTTPKYPRRASSPKTPLDVETTDSTNSDGLLAEDKFPRQSAFSIPEDLMLRVNTKGASFGHLSTSRRPEQGEHGLQRADSLGRMGWSYIGRFAAQYRKAAEMSPGSCSPLDTPLTQSVDGRSATSPFTLDGSHRLHRLGTSHVEPFIDEVRDDEGRVMLAPTRSFMWRREPGSTTVSARFEPQHGDFDLCSLLGGGSGEDDDEKEDTDEEEGDGALDSMARMVVPSARKRQVSLSAPDDFADDSESAVARRGRSTSWPRRGANPRSANHGANHAAGVPRDRGVVPFPRTPAVPMVPGRGYTSPRPHAPIVPLRRPQQHSAAPSLSSPRPPQGGSDTPRFYLLDFKPKAPPPLPQPKYVGPPDPVPYMSLRYWEKYFNMYLRDIPWIDSPRLSPADVDDPKKACRRHKR